MIIIHRGHTGKHDVDIVIKKGSAFVEKIGWGRWFEQVYLYFLKKERIVFWLLRNIVLSNAVQMLLVKFMYNVSL